VSIATVAAGATAVRADGSTEAVVAPSGAGFLQPPRIMRPINPTTAFFGMAPVFLMPDMTSARVDEPQLVPLHPFPEAIKERVTAGVIERE